MFRPDGKVLKGFSTQDGEEYTAEFFHPREELPEKFLKRKSSTSFSSPLKKQPKKSSAVKDSVRVPGRFSDGSINAKHDKVNDFGLNLDHSQDSSEDESKKEGVNDEFKEQMIRKSSGSCSPQLKKSASFDDSLSLSEVSSVDSIIAEHDKVDDQCSSLEVSHDFSEDERKIEEFHEEYKEAMNDDRDEAFFTSLSNPRNLLDEFNLTEIEVDEVDKENLEPEKENLEPEKGLFLDLNLQ